MQQPHAFLVLPTREKSEAQVFHPLYVLARQGDSWTVARIEEVEDDVLKIAPGKEVRVYYECNHRFMMQSARVVRLHANEDGDGNVHEFELEVAGEPTEAERRNDRRIRATAAGLWMQLETGERCQIADVGAKGCAIQTAQVIAVGEVIEGTITRGGLEYAGHFSVRSSQILSAGVFRYGLRCECEDAKDELLKMFNRISAELAQQQRRRLFEAA